MASDPEDQSVNPANSEVVINCVAFFYEEGKGGENYRKKNKFRCLVKRGEKRLVKFRETVCKYYLLILNPILP